MPPRQFRPGRAGGRGACQAAAAPLRPSPAGRHDSDRPPAPACSGSAAHPNCAGPAARDSDSDESDAPARAEVFAERAPARFRPAGLPSGHDSEPPTRRPRGG